MRAKCYSYQPARGTDLLLILAVSAILVSPGFSQSPPSATPQRPLRERLLERALKGEADAQFDLAKGYEGGRFGLTQDYVQASHWYQEAANQGEPFAEASLGLFYGAGKGVKQDYVLAYAWLNRSSSHLTGPERDTVMEIRDSIGRRMTPAQLKSASHALPRREGPSQPLGCRLRYLLIALGLIAFAIGCGHIGVRLQIPPPETHRRSDQYPITLRSSARSHSCEQSRNRGRHRARPSPLLRKETIRGYLAILLILPRPASRLLRWPKAFHRRRRQKRH